MCFLFLFSKLTFAQEQLPADSINQEVSKAQVISVSKEGEKEVYGYKNPFQIVKVKILDGAEKNKEITINHGMRFTIRNDQKVKTGEKVVILKTSNPTGVEYQIVDFYRLDKLWYVVIFFFVLVVALSQWKGIGSILGMIVSLGVILNYIVPQILSGHDPLLVSILGGLGIILVTIYLAHGISKKTTIALLATFISIIIAGILGLIFVDFVHLTGLGSEDAYSLRFGQTGNINFKGLLLGGIIIGTIGVLEDITTSLSATIFELAKANPKLKFMQLLSSGMSIGREHIAALVNTLVLAYAGASLPLFLFFVINPSNQPLWSILNSQLLEEEIIRTIVGSIGLVLAVPITTLLAAFFVNKKLSFFKNIL